MPYTIHVYFFVVLQLHLQYAALIVFLMGVNLPVYILHIVCKYVLALHTIFG